MHKTTPSPANWFQKATFRQWAWLGLRLLLVAAIVWGFYAELFRRNDFAQLWQLFRQNLAGTKMQWFFWCTLLMPCNWLLETLKWRKFTQPWSGMNFVQSLQAVLAGVAASMLLPNRSGDYLGRWFLAPEAQKGKILLATAAGNYCQFLVLLGMGIPAVLWLGKYASHLQMENQGALILLAVLIFLGLMQGNAWVSKGFEGLLAIGTLDRFLFNGFMTVGATRHGIWVLLMIFESKLV